MPLHGAVYVNGRIASAEEAVIPVYDHGFLYGEGVYETLRTYNRVPFLLDRHVRRLRASAGHLQLAVPFSDDELAAWIEDTMAAAGPRRKAARIPAAERASIARRVASGWKPATRQTAARYAGMAGGWMFGMADCGIQRPSCKRSRAAGMNCPASSQKYGSDTRER